MAYSDYLVERVRKRFSSALLVNEKKMMGGLIFMVNDKMCVGVDIDKKTNLDRLMVRIGKEMQEDLMKRIGCRPMDFTGKAMKGFLFIYPEGFDTEEDLDFWLNKALEFNKTIT